jgi:chaperonin GroEL
LALRNGIADLLLIVKSISDVGIGVLMEERLRRQLRVVAVKLDHHKLDDFNQSYQDIGMLTGAQAVLDAAGQSLADVRIDDFGRARWVWADDSNFGFASGGGDPRQLREQVHRLRRAYAHAEAGDNRQRLLDRLGKLQGGLATLRVGGIAEDEIRNRRDKAERTVRALRAALAEGVIPGGGLSLLRLSEWLRAEPAPEQELEARAAREILANALSAPIRTLLENAGEEAGQVLAQLQHSGENCGYEVMRGEIADLIVAGVWDVAQVQAEALQRAVTSAALALTIDVMILHREPEIMTDP